MTNSSGNMLSKHFYHSETTPVSYTQTDTPSVIPFSPFSGFYSLHVCVLVYLKW